MYTPQPRLSKFERGLVVSAIPFLALLAMNPGLMLLVSVSVLPMGFVAYWGFRLLRDIRRGKRPTPETVRRFHFQGRHMRFPKIRHRFTVSTAEPRDARPDELVR